MYATDAHIEYGLGLCNVAPKHGDYKGRHVKWASSVLNPTSHQVDVSQEVAPPHPALEESGESEEDKDFTEPL